MSRTGQKSIMDKIAKVPEIHGPARELLDKAVEKLEEELTKEGPFMIDTFFTEFDEAITEIVDSHSAAVLLTTSLFRQLVVVKTGATESVEQELKTKAFDFKRDLREAKKKCRKTEIEAKAQRAKKEEDYRREIHLMKKDHDRQIKKVKVESRATSAHSSRRVDHPSSSAARGKSLARVSSTLKKAGAHATKEGKTATVGSGRSASTRRVMPATTREEDVEVLRCCSMAGDLSTVDDDSTETEACDKRDKADADASWDFDSLV